MEMQDNTTPVKKNLAIASKIHMYLLYNPAILFAELYLQDILAKHEMPRTHTHLQGYTRQHYS